MIVLRNATALSFFPPEAESGVDVVIDGALIAARGKGAGAHLKAGADAGAGSPKLIDCTGKLVMPGLVCGHNHFYSALSRGIMAKIAPAGDFVSVLANLWWRLDRAIDRDILDASGTVAAIEAVRAGCTAVIDHHASPSFITGSLDVLKSSLQRVGLRGVLCYETTDRNGASGQEEGIQENLRFALAAERERKARGADAVLVEAMIGGHAPFTLTDSALRDLGDAVGKTGRGFHVHAAEDAFDSSFSHRSYGEDVLARLDRFGLLTEKSIVAHGLHLSAHDRELLNARGAFLAHNCRSNMNNRVGYNAHLADVRNVVLGTDGIGSDMLEEMKFAYFKHRDAGGPLQPADFARMLAAGNALIGRLFGGRFGELCAGAAADCAVLSYDPPTPLAAENAAGHAMFGMGSGSVETVIVGGRIVMENRAFPFDVSGIYANAREAAASLWARMDRL